MTTHAERLLLQLQPNVAPDAQLPTGLLVSGLGRMAPQEFHAWGAYLNGLTTGSLPAWMTTSGPPPAPKDRAEALAWLRQATDVQRLKAARAAALMAVPKLTALVKAVWKEEGLAPLREFIEFYGSVNSGTPRVGLATVADQLSRGISRMAGPRATKNAIQAAEAATFHARALDEMRKAWEATQVPEGDPNGVYDGAGNALVSAMFGAIAAGTVSTEPDFIAKWWPLVWAP